MGEGRWKNAAKVSPSCSAHNVSNVLTEDQCKWLSTKCFYSSERKKHNGIQNITSHSFYFIQLLIITILLHHIQNGFSLSCRYVFPTSARFQLTLFLGVRRARPLTPFICRPVLGSSDPGNCPFLCWAHYYQLSCS